MVHFNMHIIDQTIKDKIHPFISRIISPLAPIHYESIKFVRNHVIIDMFALAAADRNPISKHLLIVGKLVNGNIEIIEMRHLHMTNYRAPLPCSTSNVNSYTLTQCLWENKTELPSRKKSVPKLNAMPIEDIHYEKHPDTLRYKNPNCL